MKTCIQKELTKPLNYLLCVPTALVWILLLQPYNNANFDMVSSVCGYMTFMSGISILLGVFKKAELNCLTFLGVVGFFASLLSLLFLKVIATSAFGGTFLLPLSLWFTFKQASMIIACAIKKTD